MADLNKVLSSVDWKQKLSSRKLWIGTALVLIGVVLCATGDVENGITIAAIGGSAYLGAEALVDVMRFIFIGRNTSAGEKNPGGLNEEVNNNGIDR